MPHFLIEYGQKGSDEDRERHRADHIAYRKGEGDRLVMAGALLDEAGAGAGSVVLYEADTLAEATCFAEGDPMMVHNIFTLSSVRPFRVAAIKAP